MAAIAAFILATSAEWSAIPRARRSDLPGKMFLQRFVLVHGSVTAARNRKIPLLTAEQVTLLVFASKHARGTADKLFSTGRHFASWLLKGCIEAGLEPVTATDLRYASGRWLLEQGVPIEAVSRIMGHSSTTITKQVYTKTPDGRRSASKFRPPKRQPAIVNARIPEPKKRQVYSVDGVEKSFSDWARHAGVSKSTLLSRLKRGLTMAQAATMPKERERKVYSVGRVNKSLSEWARYAKMPKSTVRHRLEQGFTMADVLREAKSRRRRPWSRKIIAS